MMIFIDIREEQLELLESMRVEPNIEIDPLTLLNQSASDTRRSRIDFAAIGVEITCQCLDETSRTDTACMIYEQKNVGHRVVWVHGVELIKCIPN